MNRVIQSTKMAPTQPVTPTETSVGSGGSRVWSASAWAHAQRGMLSRFGDRYQRTAPLPTGSSATHRPRQPVQECYRRRVGDEKPTTTRTRLPTATPGERAASHPSTAGSSGPGWLSSAETRSTPVVLPIASAYLGAALPVFVVVGRYVSNNYAPGAGGIYVHEVR